MPAHRRKVPHSVLAPLSRIWHLPTVDNRVRQTAPGSDDGVRSLDGSLPMTAPVLLFLPYPPPGNPVPLFSPRLSPYPQPVNNSRPVFSPYNPHSYPPYSQVFRGQLLCRFFSSYGSEPAHLKPLPPVSFSRTPSRRTQACPVCG